MRLSPPSPYIGDIYLYSYEYDGLCIRIRLKLFNLDTLSLALLTRFKDDIFSVFGQRFKANILESVEYPLYPAWIKLTVEAIGNAVPFTDFLVKKGRKPNRLDGNMYLSYQHCPRYEKPEFAKIEFKRYVNRKSQIAFHILELP